MAFQHDIAEGSLNTCSYVQHFVVALIVYICLGLIIAFVVSGVAILPLTACVELVLSVFGVSVLPNELFGLALGILCIEAAVAATFLVHRYGPKMRIIQIKEGSFVDIIRTKQSKICTKIEIVD